MRIVFLSRKYIFFVKSSTPVRSKNMCVKKLHAKNYTYIKKNIQNHERHYVVKKNSLYVSISTIYSSRNVHIIYYGVVLFRQIWTTQEHTLLIIKIKTLSNMKKKTNFL